MHYYYPGNTSVKKSCISGLDEGVIAATPGKDSDINVDTKNPEFSEWRWSHHNLLVENIVPFKRKVYSIILEEFKNIL